MNWEILRPRSPGSGPGQRDNGVPLAWTGWRGVLAPGRPGSPAGGQDDGGCGGEHGRTGELHHQ